MAKIVLNNATGLTSINANFDKIETEFQNKVLYRDNPLGEPNEMQSTLDMNENRIINLPQPLSPNEPARLQDVLDNIVTYPSVYDEGVLIDAAATTMNFTGGAVTVTNEGEGVKIDIPSILPTLAAPGGAALIGNTPAGNIASTTVQAALNELDAEKASLAALSAGGAALIGGGIQVVDTYAALRALLKTSPSKYAVVTAKTTPGDGGYGTYRLDLADVTTPDDNFHTIVATDGGRWKRLRLVWQTTTGGADAPTVQIARNTSHTGGTPGVVTNALNVSLVVTDSAVANFEWGFLSQLDNFATAGENVSIYGQSKKRAQGPTWAACFEIQDHHTANPAAGGALGIEVACSGNGADTNLQRNGVHITAVKLAPGGLDLEWGCAFRSSFGTGTRYRNAYLNESPFAVSAFSNTGDSSVFAGSATFKDTGKAVNGIDLSGATYSGVAMLLAAGQGIAFDVTGTPARIRKAGSNLAFENSPALFSGGRVVMNNGFGMPSSGNTAATATTGASGALPAQVAGYVIFQLDGSNFKIPYYGP